MNQACEFSEFYQISGILPQAKYLKSGKSLTFIETIFLLFIQFQVIWAVLTLIFYSSDAGDGMFWLWGSIPCLLMPWLLKSPEHQQA